MAKKSKQLKSLKHHETRLNIPTAEYQGVVRDSEDEVKFLNFTRRNMDIDPQLCWRGKDEQNLSDFIVPAPPLYIQEKIHPQALIDELKKTSHKQDVENEKENPIPKLFADFDIMENDISATEFYQHEQNWSNRLIVGDSLLVMASIAEREGLRGKVQCIYFDPPYGIKFNSNFQWSTNNKTVKDGNITHITREPEQVRAYRDTWKDGVHSYLTYIRDRLSLARDLLKESGSIFVQISDENVHRVRILLDEIFGEDNFINQINYRTNSGTTRESSLKRTCDYILWYGKDRSKLKFRRLLVEREHDYKTYSKVENDNGKVSNLSSFGEKRNIALTEGNKIFRTLPLYSMSPGDTEKRKLFGKYWGIPKNRGWRFNIDGFYRLSKANRIIARKSVIESKYYHNDFPYSEISETWTDTGPEINKKYIVQTSEKIIERCIQMASSPGDLILDPTCGSGTTAYVAEKLGRRWITIDTSRVAIALTRMRLIGAKFPYYFLSDSKSGQLKEAELSNSSPKTTKTNNNVNHDFVYYREEQISMSSISRNIEIDLIWEKMQPEVEKSIKELNKALKGHKVDFVVENGGRVGEEIKFRESGKFEFETGEFAPINGFMEWEIPNEAPSHWPNSAKTTLKNYWKARLSRQKEIDASIKKSAETTFLYDNPVEDESIVRVSGPFTVESISPIKSLTVDWDDSLVEEKVGNSNNSDGHSNFVKMILKNLTVTGVQQAHKENKIDFKSLQPWPGIYICAEGTYMEGKTERRAGIFIGPEFGIVNRPDLVAASREASEVGFDVLVACAFNYDAHSTEFDSMGKIPILKARMNPDLHMAGELAESKGGNLFVVFGEPEIKIIEVENEMLQVQIFGVDVFKPQTGQVVPEGTDGIALWLLDTNYNEESFYTRHAYFLGANDPYQSLKTTLNSEINEEAWQSVNSDISRPFPKPSTGRIAVKVINHLGDEVMKIFSIQS